MLRSICLPVVFCLIARPAAAEILTFPGESDPHLYLHERVSNRTTHPDHVRLQAGTTGSQRVEVSDLTGEFFVTRGPFKMSVDDLIARLERAGITSVGIRQEAGPDLVWWLQALGCAGMAVTGISLAFTGDTVNIRNFGRGMLLPAGLWGLSIGFDRMSGRSTRSSLDPAVTHEAIAEYNRRIDENLPTAPPPGAPE
ncbi:MAG: hypothetical protein VKP72_10250 [bacterium]|nr:hypothetical protein [bacterium]